MLARHKGRPATSQMAPVPAPTGGLNRVDPASKIPDGDCILLSNLVAAEYGLRSRLGNHEWVTGLIGTLDNTVRTIIPYKSGKSNGSSDKLFATTDQGIWDVTSSTAAPTAPSGTTAFGTVNSDSGWGSFVTAVAADGSHNLLFCDEANGYFTYAESGGAWTKVAQGSGATQVQSPDGSADPTKFVQACIYASRVWFVQKDSSKAYYLGVFGGPAIYGTAQPFDFGPYFRSGGALVGLYVWTIGGDTSIANRLVAISSGGDVVVFQGIDPSIAVQWSIVGQYHVGGVPAGRRIASDFGGDLLILSSTGIIPLSRLVNGASIADRSQFVTYKITNLFNQLMYSYSGNKGWSVRLNPQDNTLMITVPQSGDYTSQLVMALTNKSWTQYSGLDVVSNDVWKGIMYFGTSDGRVCQHTDYIDGVTLANPNAFTPISCFLLTGFSNLGVPNKKRVHLIRPKLLAQGVSPTSSVAAKFDYDLSVPAAPQSPTSNTGSASWDTAVWDSSLWQGDYTPIAQGVQGSAGIGTDVALALSFQAVARTIFVGFDVVYDSGSFL